MDFSGVMDPHIVAGLLKMYIRELADPLLTFELVSGNYHKALFVNELIN